MGKRKSHHYIPRFYLRRFSINYEGKSIGLYNHVRNIYIANAPIKHQACEDFLYGSDDDVEAYLAKLENIIGNFFNHWVDKKHFFLPPENTNGLTVLKRFILYQLYRTPKAGLNVSTTLNNAFHMFANIYYPDKLNDIKDTTLVHKSPTLLSLLNSADKEYLLNFLSCKFIVNLTELSFITSDSPVVLYNQLMEEKGVYMWSTAPVAKGLQLFYPIHPRLMICFYDPEIYDFGEGARECVGTESINDIHQLNVLQYLNSNAQLFFDETIDRDYNESLVKDYKKIKERERQISEYYKTSDNRQFLFFSHEDAHIQLDLSFFKIKSDIEDFEVEICPLRHPSLERKVQ